MTTTVKTQTPSRPRTYERFTLLRRIEHALMILSFTVLAITGLPQKFAGADWAETMIVWMGNIETVRTIHHAAAILLVLVSVLEVLILGYKIFVERSRWTMLPGLQDGFDALNQFLFNLGLRKEAPKFDRYSWGEKFEYWALIWGTLIMALTGFILWNPILATRILPGEFIPVAKAAHGGEAILAVLAVITWHFYNVHLKTLNTSMLTGKLSAHEMQEEHPLELERMSKQPGKPLAAQVLAQRKRLFYPAAGVAALVMLGAVYFLTATEKTALTTISPAEPTQLAFVPRTFTPTMTRVPTITPTPQPTATLMPGATPAAQNASMPFIPEDHVGRTTCVVCHSTGAGGAPKYPDDHAGRADGTCTSCHTFASASNQSGATAPAETPAAGTTPEANTTATANSGIPFMPLSHEGRTTCLSCHARGFEGAPANPPDHEGREDGTCTACHTLAPAEGSNTTAATPGAGTSSGLPAAIPADHEGRTLCLACHDSGYIGSPLVPADHKGRDDKTCSSCHKPEGENGAGGTTETTTTPEANTTPDATGAPEATTAPVSNGLPAQIPADHTGVMLCTTCHSTGEIGAPVFPSDHQGRDNTTCESCHTRATGDSGGGTTASEETPAASAPAAAGTPEASPTTGAAASNGVPEPIPADHAGVILCTACHATGQIGAPIFPADHAGRENSTCESCHKRD